MTRASDTAKLLGAGATILDGTTISTADNTDQLTLLSTDADANVGPNLNLYRNSGSPADNDVLGLIIYNGRNDNSQDVIYARQLSYIKDASDGTEDGQLTLQTMVAGTIRDRLNINPTEIVLNEDSQDLDFRVEGNGNTHAMFIKADTDEIFFRKSVRDDTIEGTTIFNRLNQTTNGDTPLLLNRGTDDGTLVILRQNNNTEGTISVSGSTVSYNGGHLSRYSQLTDNSRDNTIVKGTVMTNLDQMAEWTTDGVTEDNEQLNCMAVSSVDGDANVAGVFVNWDDDDDVYTNDMNVAMTGDMVIRIAQGVTVARGDLLISAGDGTAKTQDDDIVRSKTIAKVTSTIVSHTYDDGTYLVPCVLMAC